MVWLAALVGAAEIPSCCPYGPLAAAVREFASNSGLRELRSEFQHGFADTMKSSKLKTFAIAVSAALVLTGSALSQQDTGPIQGNAGQASQPAGVTSGPGNPASSTNAAPAGGTGSPSSTAPQGAKTTPPDNAVKDQSKPTPDSSSPGTDNSAPLTDNAKPQTDTDAPRSDQPRTVVVNGTGDDNPNNPLLETPALPQGKPTLIGGKATGVDHVRNLLTVEPFGGGKKLKMFLDERTHIYRNGAETTVLGIRKGDRVYVDTMLDGARVFAKNVRVENQAGGAEVRGQVTAVNHDKGTVTVKDELSSQPVTFSIDNSTAYSAYKGSATNSDLRQGALVDVQFAPGREKRDVAREIILLARPGDSYVFSGVVTNVNMRDGTLALENRSDDQTYELHFGNSALDDRNKLKVGAEVTAHAVFDGKQYTANDLQIQQVAAAEQSKDQ